MIGAKPSQQAANSSIPQGSVLRPILFNIFIEHIGDGMVSILSKFADDTKFGGEAVSMLEDRAATQGDQDRLKKY